MTKIGINGFGRIGRLILRALLENYKDKIQVVGINDLGSIDTNAHLIKYDSTHGTLNYDVQTSKDGFKILNQNIKVFAERDPANLPWGKIGADVVLECTGLFLNNAQVNLWAKERNSFNSTLSIFSSLACPVYRAKTVHPIGRG